MNKNSARPVVNLEGLLDAMGGDQEMFEQFLKKIPKHALTSFQTLQNAVNNKNAEEIEFAAHSLRGICLYLEMYRVTEITLEIEKLAGQNKFNEISGCMLVLNNELQKGLSFIIENKGLILHEAA